jgi:hypothetical protein
VQTGEKISPVLSAQSLFHFSLNLTPDGKDLFEQALSFRGNTNPAFSLVVAPFYQHQTFVI